MELVPIAIVALAISIVVIPIMMRIAPRVGMIDHPHPRKVHSAPVSRVGGWGVVLGGIVPVLLWLPLDPLTVAYLAGAALLLLSGAWDDTVSLSPATKLVAQCLAVAPTIFYADLYVIGWPFLAPVLSVRELDIALTFLAMVGMINAVNTSDGLDGLAGGEALLSLIVIALLAYLAGGWQIVIIALATIGALLGFLRYNTHPAHVFLGDGGSQFLGFTLAFLAVLLTQRVDPALSPVLPLFFLGMPVIDLLVAIVRRLRAGRNCFQADRDHIHHRLLRLGFTHGESVVLIYGVHAFFAISALFLRYESDLVLLALYGGLCGLGLALLATAERHGWQVQRGRSAAAPEAQLVTRSGRPLIRVGPPLVVAVVVPLYLVVSSVSAATVPKDVGFAAIGLFVVLLLELLYRRAGSRLVLRVVVYTTASFVVYLGIFHAPARAVFSGLVEAAFFTVMMLAIGISIRYAAREDFRLTPTDYLVVLVVIAMALWSGVRTYGDELALMLIKLIVITYGCELLLSRMASHWNGITVGSLLALGILGGRALL